MHHFPVSWHNSSEIFLLKPIKEPIKVQIFRFLSALMKVHPIPHASFETTRTRFVQIFHQCSVSWMIALLYFSISNLYTLDKKSPSKWNFQTFECWVKIHRIVYTILFDKQSIFDPHPEICLSFSKKSPQKIVDSNCLVNDLLSSILQIFKHFKCYHSSLQGHLEYAMHTFEHFS